jgi:hypothetical protein
MIAAGYYIADTTEGSKVAGIFAGGCGLLVLIIYGIYRNNIHNQQQILAELKKANED